MGTTRSGISLDLDEDLTSVLALTDRPAPEAARELIVTGLYQRGLVGAVRPELDALPDAGFFVAMSLYRDTLVQAGEGGSAAPARTGPREER